ncbi:hypothetical protein RvY_08582 [Ramazzottius varieornatus]|uniref:E2F/DP family winged-helix DNA-binding domain-containing protein n=1 Tax=Ramazzottius varieornatus TaxID=947166 RepID=A0A1D1V8Z6_RAMVA|nr:hypothetical protein RvY_08582 [Ramazzottius varieornatus]
MSQETQPFDSLPFQIIKVPDNYTVSMVQPCSSTSSRLGQAVVASAKNGTQSSTVYLMPKGSVAATSGNLGSSGVFKMPYPPPLTALLKGRTPIVLKQLSNANVSRKPGAAAKKRRTSAPRESWVVKGTKRSKPASSDLPTLAPAPSIQGLLEHTDQFDVVVKSESSGATTEKSKTRRCNGEESGLRYFAAKVSDKVREKQVTTYNVVAEELAISGTSTQTSQTERLKEKKNIRRRVYDALNVLMSIGVIRKDGSNNIAWCGNPRNLAEAIAPVEMREEAEQRKRKCIRQLRQRVFHSSLLYLALKDLAEENKKRDMERTVEKPSAESLKGKSEDQIRKIHSIASIIAEFEYDETQRLQLPFIFLTCPRNSKVEISVGKNSAEHEVRFAEPFNIVEDTEVLHHTPLVRALDSGDYTEEQLAQAIARMPAFMNPTLSELVKMNRNRLRTDAETKMRKSMEAELAASLKAPQPAVVKKAPRPLTKPRKTPPVKQKEIYTSMPLQQFLAQGLAIKLADKEQKVLTSILKK